MANNKATNKKSNASEQTPEQTPAPTREELVQAMCEALGNGQFTLSVANVPKNIKLANKDDVRSNTFMVTDLFTLVVNLLYLWKKSNDDATFRELRLIASDLLVGMGFGNIDDLESPKNPEMSKKARACVLISFSKDGFSVRKLTENKTTYSFGDGATELIVACGDYLLVL